MSPDIAKYSLGTKVAPGWEPLNYIDKLRVFKMQATLLYIKENMPKY